MALDILNGDILVVGSTEYPIRAVAVQAFRVDVGATFPILATVTASTKRPPAMSGGKRGAPVAQIASMKCTPLDTVNAEVAKRAGLDTPMNLLQTFCDGGRIQLVVERLLV
jgi:hypothetical protein